MSAKRSGRESSLLECWMYNFNDWAACVRQCLLIQNPVDEKIYEQTWIQCSHLKQYLYHCSYVTNPTGRMCQWWFLSASCCCGSLSLGCRSTVCSLISTFFKWVTYEKRCLNNLCGWTPPHPMCGLWPAPLFKQPLPSPLHWTLSYLQIWLFGSVAPKKHCCHSVLQGAFIGVIRVMTEEDGSRTLGEDTHGAYLTQPANSASTWNSPACSHGNKETGSAVSLADAFGAAHSLNDGSPTRPLNTSHTMSLYHDG